MAHIRARETQDGTRYDVRYVVNGEERSDTFRSRADAQARLTRVRADDLAGLIVDPRGGERLFGQYADQWLEHRLVKGRPLTPATRQGYEGLLRRNIRPSFERTKLRQITPERVRRWHSELTAAAGADAAAKSYRVLRAIMNTALADELIARNPCHLKGAGIEHAAERPMLDSTTVMKLAAAIEPRFRVLVLLGGFVGFRTGELLGLTRQDIDLLHRVVHVRRQAQEIEGRRIVTEPKTEAGIRGASIPSALVNILDEHINAYAAPGPDGWVFTGRSGRPVRRADLSVAWRAAVASVGLADVRIHDLRHHAATMYARKRDITLKELMAILGHASPVAALRYQHATAERGRELADYMDGVIASAEEFESPPSATIVRLGP